MPQIQEGSTPALTAPATMPAGPGPVPGTLATAAAIAPAAPFDVQGTTGGSGANPAPAVPQAQTHPYFDRIAPVFYNYRLTDFNRRYHIVFLERARRKSLCAQIIIGALGVIAVAILSFPAALSDEAVLPWVHRVNPVAAVLSVLAFIAAVIVPMFGWDKEIDDFTTHVHAWHFAENQIEAALRFLIHDAKNDRDAELGVWSANTAFGTATSLPQVGQREPALSKTIKDAVEKAIPPDYPWVAL
jgi:hypothetical protein